MPLKPSNTSPANAERTALNSAIRGTLQAQRHLPREEIAHPVLINRNITGAERTWARSYQVGEVLRYRAGSQKLGIAAGAYARVEGVDAERNRVTIRTEEGISHTYAPSKLKGIEVYREEGREFAVGERIQFRAPLKAQQIPNGALGRIEKLDHDMGQVTIALDTGSSLTTNLKDLRHLEYGYATTSHSSQGATIDRVLVNIDTEQSVALVNQQQFYVSLSRARHDARVFTNKREELSQVVSRSWPKATALDAVAKPIDDLQHVQHNERSIGAALYDSLQQQRDVALLVRHRQRDWRLEPRPLVQENTMGRSLTEKWKERSLPDPQDEKRAERKPGLHKGIAYRR